MVKGFNRRQFLQAIGVGISGVPLLGAGSTTGTTLDRAATPIGATGYRRLTAGPGWPLVLREDLATAKPGRENRRTALACFVQFSDMHICDAQSPMRFEYVHPVIGSGAHRPQETLTAIGSTALVRKVNSLEKGPYTGRKFDFVMTTGDNTDNHETVELEWFLQVLNGGTITPNTGDLARFEGVQNANLQQYWQPHTSASDDYKVKGFPAIPGLLDAAIRPFTSPGLDVPWYCTVGNHDDSVVGALPDGLLDGVYTGRRKVVGFGSAVETRKVAAALTDPKYVTEALALLTTKGVVRTVTPDARRVPFTPGEFVRAHLDPRNTGPGPAGHGFTTDNADGKDVYYAFRIADGVTGISLDTTTLGGFADGSIGWHQYRWLEDVLRRGGDQRFIVFSHHTSRSMGNVLPDRRRPLDPRLTGDALVRLLRKYPRVVAWVNGHTHRNEITAHGSFWEINTAAHVDYPQHARIIEIVDNGDGTLSLFTTLIEPEAPYQAGYDDLSESGLAAHYRELMHNDVHLNPARLGKPADRNTELVLTVR
ncbi:TIGR03767 family metallophosphoesterase [Lentzea tibetensis]|uniref:TIGR03767 family metallophosphoesterase n=1 Tax=Lentzea tibetensis TaxID=2591470 RepID=A0A563EHR4_9PSEU|nr:TIGR03767 family metallophosphoesterase [Lentzea tibetensis]TWP46007.1 TIGR03767 family metallophosphoesterase [Lentzea tibetensis]